ncbi:MAG: phage tail protein [Verrucomicrobiales bacterium]
MTEPYIGQITMFAGHFAPRNWAFCDGQLLSVSQYNALFSVIGDQYGGDGKTTFALPDLRGRMPVHAGSGNGPGQTAYPLGSHGGRREVQLTEQHLPAHTHSSETTVTHDLSLKSATVSRQNNPLNNALGPSDQPIYGSPADDQLMAPKLVSGSIEITNTNGQTGDGHPIDTMPPYACVNFVIALEGIYPPRS